MILFPRPIPMEVHYLVTLIWLILAFCVATSRLGPNFTVQPSKPHLNSLLMGISGEDTVQSFAGIQVDYIERHVFAENKVDYTG